MGSRVIALVDCDEAPAALAGLPAEFEEWEQVLSRFRLDSELTRLNRQAGTPTIVSPVLWDVFDAARAASGLTGGLVNPLIAHALVQAGYDRSFEELRNVELASGLPGPLSTIPSLDEVMAEASTHMLCLPEGSELDFGGIAKGWAAQQAMLALQAYGPALVSAGGDIAISGPQRDGEQWSVGVDDPFEQGALVDTLLVAQGGIATSGRDYRTWTRGGVPQHHIIDPRTGEPARTDILTATVIAPDLMQAEAIAKALLILGSDAALAWLNSNPSLAGLLVLESGLRLYSDNISR